MTYCIRLAYHELLSALSKALTPEDLDKVRREAFELFPAPALDRPKRTNWIIAHAFLPVCTGNLWASWTPDQDYVTLDFEEKADLTKVQLAYL